MIGYKTLESTTSGLGVMSHFTSVVAIAPPMGRLGRAFGFLVPATTTTI